MLHYSANKLSQITRITQELGRCHEITISLDHYMPNSFPIKKSIAYNLGNSHSFESCPRIASNAMPGRCFMVSNFNIKTTIDDYAIKMLANIILYVN